MMPVENLADSVISRYQIGVDFPQQGQGLQRNPVNLAPACRKYRLNRFTHLD